MSFIQSIEKIGSDIMKGAEVASSILGTIDPPLAPILHEVASVIEALEAQGKSLTVQQMSSLVQAVSTVNAVKTESPTIAAKLP